MNTPVDFVNDLGHLFGFGQGGEQKKLEMQQLHSQQQNLSQQDALTKMAYDHFVQNPHQVPAIQDALTKVQEYNTFRVR